MIFFVNIWSFRSYWLSIAGLFLCATANGQRPFANTGQSWQIMNDIDAIVELVVHPDLGTIRVDTITSDIPENLECLAYNNADRTLYGMHPEDRTLYQIDADGVVRTVADLDINPGWVYTAGGISPDGRYFSVIGTDLIRDFELVHIDLQSPDFEATTVNMATSAFTIDIAYHPYTGRLYGYDLANRQFTEIDIATGEVSPVANIEETGEVGGVFFTPFGEFRGFGTTQFGVAGAIYQVDLANGSSKIINTSGVEFPRDMAANTATFGVRAGARPREAFPCEEVRYTLTFANSTGTDAEGLSFQYQLPEEITWTNILRNPFAAGVSLDPNTGLLSMTSLTIPPGIDSMVLGARIEDVEAGRYRAEGRLVGLPVINGSSLETDDPVSRASNDSTLVRVNRIEDDSVQVKRFLCLGQEVELDASDYGNNVVWWNGQTAPSIVVDSAGYYSFEASTDCNTTFVGFEVTVAQCPFTIEIAHDIQPRETFPCSEVEFSYIVENDAGVVQSGLTLTDTLRAGLEFIEVMNVGALNGRLVDGTAPNVLTIEDLEIAPGYDTVRARVLVGNLAPGEIANKAILDGLPADVGARRLSDDPLTQPIDSTRMTVLGLDQDTLRLNLYQCSGDLTLLDASSYGKEFRWYDGSTAPSLEVAVPGSFGVTVFDGCDESYVVFEVTRAPDIAIVLDSNFMNVELSNEVVLEPLVLNEGDSFSVQWTDPLDTSMSCLTCLPTVALPLADVTYSLSVDNGFCLDSADIRVFVDKTRRLYIPNIFSPNGDGVNDRFVITSPDYGLVRQFVVRDRWGSVIHQVLNVNVNDHDAGWDGRSQGNIAAQGVYTWSAEVEFFDGVLEWFNGEITVIR